jgi:Domain of unknown function (DUF4124)
VLQRTDSCRSGAHAGQRTLVQEDNMQHLACRLTSCFVGLLIAQAALGAAASANAGVIYRWVDKQGKTHFGDAVPSAYKDVAKAIDNEVTVPSEEQLARAIERAAQQKEKARAASAPKPPPLAPARAPSAPAGSVVPKRPPNAPNDDTDCDTWRRLYRESLDCFGPYRTAHGATKAEGFARCTSVNEPPDRCGRNAQ